MELTNPLIQIKKGALEFCVLALIARGESYGYEIVKVLDEEGLTTPEGTVYPLLARLQGGPGIVLAAMERETPKILPDYPEVKWRWLCSGSTGKNLNTVDSF